MDSWTTNHGNAPIFNDVIELPKSSQQLIYDMCVCVSLILSSSPTLLLWPHMWPLNCPEEVTYAVKKAEQETAWEWGYVCVCGCGCIYPTILLYVYCKKTGGKLRKSSTNRSPHPTPLTLTFDSPSATNYNLLESFCYNILYSPAVFVLYSHRPKSACCLWDNSFIQYCQQ